MPKPTSPASLSNENPRRLLQAFRMLVSEESNEELEQGIIEDEQRLASLLEQRPKDTASISRFEQQIKIRKSLLDVATVAVDERKVQMVHFPTPDDLRWEEISIEFISNVAVRIRARTIDQTYNFAEMGFKDGRRRDEPTSLWRLLKVGFARHSGEVDWSTRDVHPNVVHNLKEKVSKYRKIFKAFFQINDDPFHDYLKVKAYRTRFSIKDSTPEESR